MKAKNLTILAEHGINVPKFVVLKETETVSPALLFLLSNDKTYAVRSSFNGEDGVQDSFAGQFDTILDVSKDSLKEAVDRVRQSFLQQNVIEYARAKSINNNSVGQVIIQEMVQADYSGVVFTANPLGILNETVIVVGQGLGNNIVEDKIHTTSYFYNQDDNLYYYEQQEDSPTLSDEIVRHLVEQADKIKKIFEYDMDIEFAIKDGVVYILQARPITTLKKENIIILDNSNIVESYPGISLPLTQDFVREVYAGVFKSCIARVTKSKRFEISMKNELNNMVDVANGRIYYRISNWYAVLKLLPFSKKIIPMWQKMLGVNHTFVSATPIKASVWVKCNILMSLIKYLSKTPHYMDVLNDNFTTLYPKYQKMVEKSNNIKDLLSIYSQIKEAIFSQWDITLINDMYTFIYTALANKKNTHAISNIEDIESLKPVLGIYTLVDVAREYGMDSDKYRFEAKQYINKYGDRCLGELKLETETYRTNPEKLNAYIRTLVMENKHFEVPIENTKNSKNPFVKRAKIGIKNREISRMNRSRLYGLAREIFYEIGIILYKNGRIDNVIDVFYLHIDELSKENINLKELINQRRKEYANYEQVLPYSRLVFDGKVKNKTVTAHVTNVYANGSCLTGIPTSTGSVVGEVVVVDDPNNVVDTNGKILVTKTTDPGWVFLIHNAVGIIAEKGSLLSHTAIISRELNKPAIVNVKDCTAILKTGDLVELDAEIGIVKILKEGKTNV